MNLKIEKLVNILLISMLFLSITMVTVPIAFADMPTRTVKVIPALTEVNATCSDITFAVVVEDPYDNMSLYGLAMVLSWDTTYLSYVDHTCTIPIEDFPTPIAPSPYAGLLYGGILWVGPAGGKINETAGTYSVDCSSMDVPPPPSFNGSGTILILTLHVDYQPFDFEIFPDEYLDTLIELVSVELPNVDAKPIPHDDEDAVVRIYARPFVYPPVPLLKVMPEEISGYKECENFPVDIWLMGDRDLHTGLLTDLDPFWDVAGFDMTLNFDATLIEAIAVTIDPTGWFGAFWPGGTYVIPGYPIIDNVAGTVQVAFIGMGVPHSPPYGKGILFNVTFHSIVEFDTYPPPSSPIYLKNPIVLLDQMILDAEDSLIEITDPICTMWHELSPNFCGGPYHLYNWQDENGDSKLSPCDQIKLNNTDTGYWFDYHVDSVDVTLELTFSRTISDLIWAASFGPNNLDNNGLPGRYIGTDDPYDGFGVPNWTGNFTVEKTPLSINSITVNALPFTPDAYTYTLAPSDYVLHPDGKIELLTGVDVDILNEYWVDGVNNSLNGWPMINYVASGIESVNFQNSTDLTIRPARNNGYAAGPPGEWWYDPDWAWELEGWWALGYFGGPETWPPGSGWWINYTAASYLTVDYNFEPEKVYVESQGSYDDGLAALSAPVCTMWSEVFPFPWNEYHIVDWIDSDASGEMDTCDFIYMENTATEVVLEYHVDDVHTDITVSRKQCICDYHPGCEFYCNPPIVDVAGFPHPERALCPWHGSETSLPLPHVVEDATYTAAYVPAIGIDVYTQYPDPFGGQGAHNPSDMFFPQKEVILCAYVMYNYWPEQNKDVAFEVKDNHGEIWGVWYARTDSNGFACVSIRLPWTCEDPEFYLGEWHVTATVDIACDIYTDTLAFKYDYFVNIWPSSHTDKTSYKHCDTIEITIDYGTYWMQHKSALFTVTAVDESGVPFGFAYTWDSIGGAKYCQYENGTFKLYIHVPKFARAGLAKLYLGALSNWPQNGGSAHCPLVTLEITIEAL